MTGILSWVYQKRTNGQHCWEVYVLHTFSEQSLNFHKVAKSIHKMNSIPQQVLQQKFLLAKFISSS